MLNKKRVVNKGFLEVEMRSQPNNQNKTNSVEVQPEGQYHVVTDTRTLVSLIALIPILALLGTLAYQKYRGFVKRKQIALLERLWLLDINNKTH